MRLSLCLPRTVSAGQRTAAHCHHRSSASILRSLHTASPASLQPPSRSFSTSNPEVDSRPESASAAAPTPVHAVHHDTNGSFVPRFSVDPLGRSLTSTTARLWQLRRATAAAASAAPAAVPSINNQSQLYPRHPRFESMDKQLASMLHHLSHQSSQRPYLLPTDSALSILLPLKSSPLIYDQYVRFDGGVRFGKVLEDLDAFAANIAHMHLLLGSTKRDQTGTATYLPPGEVMLVTATVDSIVLQRRFPMDHDVLMKGRVAWVGTSSLEVNITMYAVVEKQHGHEMSGAVRPLAEQDEQPVGTSADRWEKPPVQQEVEYEVGTSTLDFGALPPAGTYTEEKILDAVFLMVARNAKTNKSAAVCPLAVEEMNDEDRTAFEQGEKNKERRKQNMAKSLTRAPPTSEEVALLHHFLMKDNTKPTTTTATIPPPNPSSSSSPLATAALPTPSFPASIRAKSCPMHSTEMQSSDMTQPQERNTNGKIFGGSLMRRAYELARTTAYVFAGPNAHPYLVASDTITFLRPVEIGSVIEFGAKVVYSGGWPDRLFQVKVETHIRDLISGQQFMSNTFQFTYACDSVPIRRVEPELYSEAMEWLEGRRLVVQFQARTRNEQRGAQRAGTAVSSAVAGGGSESAGDAVKSRGPAFITDATAEAD